VNLVQRILEGDRLALARLLSLIENEEPEGQAALAELYPHTGRAHLVGITGPPGVG
jgi:LAO/AO transport system kinase